MWAIAITRFCRPIQYHTFDSFSGTTWRTLTKFGSNIYEFMLPSKCYFHFGKKDPRTAECIRCRSHGCLPGKVKISNISKAIVRNEEWTYECIWPYTFKQFRMTFICRTYGLAFLFVHCTYLGTGRYPIKVKEIVSYCKCFFLLFMAFRTLHFEHPLPSLL